MNKLSELAGRSACAAVATLMIVGVAGCSAPAVKPAASASAPEVVEASTPAPTAVATTPAAASVDDMMAEREQFMADQQVQPGVTLVATTPEQIEFTTRQRDFVESQGGTYSPEYEDLILALALNACETSILNGHDIDAQDFATHVATSPQIQNIVASTDAARGEVITRNLTEIMRDGTYYFCPADYPQWEAAWEETYGG